MVADLATAPSCGQAAPGPTGWRIGHPIALHIFDAHRGKVEENAHEHGALLDIGAEEARKTLRFDHLPADRNVFSRYGSTLTARPSVAAPETLTITFLSIDLGDLELPAELPPAKDITQPMSPTLAMASVGFSYVDGGGSEWAGPGTLRVESFSDGRISGSFQAVSLPHVDGALEPVELADGTFSAQLR